MGSVFGSRIEANKHRQHLINLAREVFNQKLDWKKELNEVSLIPVTNLIRATVHVSVNFILIVGTHTGIKSTFLKDVMLKKKENRTKFDAAALDFFGEFETPKKRPHEDIVVSSTTTTTKSKRLSSRKKK